MEKQKADFFGEHAGITCDGCGCGPIVGYRYRCTRCANHDVCEACFDAWKGGEGEIKNGLASQRLSSNPKDHNFDMHKDKGFKSLVKGVVAAAVAKKPKPNEPCSCDSGKKYKKCCGAGGK